jgi:hypothetical protein
MRAENPNDRYQRTNTFVHETSVSRCPDEHRSQGRHCPAGGALTTWARAPTPRKRLLRYADGMSESIPIEQGAPTPGELRIARSRGKLALLVLGAAAFVAVSVLLLVFTDFRDPKAPPRVFLWAGALFFGACLVAGARSLFRRTPGLVLRADGFVDASSPISVGFVPWKDVAALAIATIHSQRMLVVKLHDPAPYLARGNALARLVHRANLKLTGSPINLASNSLRISFDELVQLVTARVVAAHRAVDHDAG